MMFIISLGAFKPSVEFEARKGAIQVGLQVASGPQAAVGAIKFLKSSQVVSLVLLYVLMRLLLSSGVAKPGQGSSGPAEGQIK